MVHYVASLLGGSAQENPAGPKHTSYMAKVAGTRLVPQSFDSNSTRLLTLDVNQGHEHKIMLTALSTDSLDSTASGA